MKNFLRFYFTVIICALAFTFAVVNAQSISKNGTPQAPNYDFETWENPEPWGWNSSSCFEAGHSPSKEVYNQSIWKSTDKRPGSKGSFSAQIKVTQSQWYHYSFPIGSTSKEQMGTLTTGVLYYYDDKGNGSSCIYTNTDKNAGDKRWAFNGRPDSVVFWVKTAANGGRNSDFTMYLHNNAELEDRNPNGTVTGTVIGSASCKIAANSAWHRVSLPIKYNSTSNPNYLLASFTAGNNFRSVVNGDNMFVDDMMFIYKPSLKIENSIVKSVPRRKDKTFELDIPFVISGTMSPFNNLPDNEVIAYLSDETGNFAQQVELGRFTTDESGSLKVNIPNNLPSSSNYKLKLVSTNYPLTSNIVNLDIYFVYNLNIAINKPWAGKVNKVDTLVREYTPWSATVLETAIGNHFNCWEDLYGSSISAIPSYEITLDKDISLIARFDTNYYDLKINQSLGGIADFAENNDSLYSVIHNGTASLRATPSYGYHFTRWTSGGAPLSESNPFELFVTREYDIKPVFDTNEYNLLFKAEPANLGNTTGSGTYKHFYQATSTATANPYCTFLYWKKAGSTDVYSYENTIDISLVSEAEEIIAYFEEDLYKVSVSQNLPNGGSVLGDSTYSAFKLTEEAKVEAIPEYGYHFTHWTYSIDGVKQNVELTQNPYIILENGHLDHNYDFIANFDSNRYTVSANSENGLVKGAGIYVHGIEVSLSATPDSGYHFVKWINNSNEVLSTEAVLVFSQILNDTSVTAVFEINKYTVDVVVEGDEFGDILSPTAGEYDHFTTLNLTAEPGSGSEFRFWIVNKDTVSTTANFSISIDGNKEIVAVFTPLRKALSISASPASYGTATGGGYYEHASEATAIAKAKRGYHFVHWEDAHGNTYLDNPLVISSITQDTSFTAFFEIDIYQTCISANNPLGGSVSIQNTEELCAAFPFQSQIDISATPNASHHFIAWQNAQGDIISKDNNFRLFLTQDTSLTAIFEINKYAVSASVYPEGAGTIEGVGEYEHGASATLTAETKFGYVFEGWYDGDILLSTDTSYGVENIDNTKFYTAHFSIKEYDLYLAAIPEEAGTVKGGGSVKYAYNARIEAQANKNYSFNGWYTKTGDLISNKSVFYPTVTDNDTIFAHFNPLKANVKWSTLPIADAGSIENSSDIYKYGEIVSVSAKSNYGYSFDRWVNLNENEYVLGYTETLEFTASEDVSIAAIFKPNSFAVSVEAIPTNGGSISGNGNAPYNSLHKLTAQAAEHYVFEAWLNTNGDTVSVLPELEVEIDGDIELLACFKPAPAKVIANCDPLNSGAVKIEGECNYFNTVKLTATAANGYIFSKWSDGDTELSKNITLNSDKELTAYFEKAYYPVSISASPNDKAGTTEGSGLYTYSEKVPLHSEASKGYSFYAYTNETDEIISFDPNYILSVYDTADIVANFVPNRYQINAIATDMEAGSVNGGGVYAYEEEVVISAVSINDGYIFSHWSTDENDLYSENQTINLVVDRNLNLYAHFELKSLFVNTTLEPTNAGEVTGDGTALYGSEIKLTATPFEGYEFVGFKEYGLFVCKQNTYEFTLTEESNITAVFEKTRVNITGVDIPENTSISGNGSFDYGSDIELTAILPANMQFVAWVNNKGERISTSNPFIFTAKTDSELSFICEEKVLFLNTIVKPSNAGSVTTGEGSYPYATDVILKAEPKENYAFVGWQENGLIIGSSDSLFYKILNDAEITAVFKPITVNISLLPNLIAGGDVNGSGSYSVGEEVSAKAIAKEGYSFVSWSENGIEVSTEPVYSFYAENDHTIVANFELNKYRITASSNPILGATVSGGGIYTATDTVKLSISVYDSYEFVAWMHQDQIISTELSFSFCPDKDMEITALLKKLFLDISAEGYPINGGNILGSGTYQNGDVVTLNAISNNGYYFDQWVDDNMNTVSWDPAFSFKAHKDVHYTALFAQKSIDDKEDKVIVYPTPCRDHINIVGNNLDKIYFFNSFGTKVAECNLNSSTSSIFYTSFLPSGMYTYTIIRNNGKLINGKFIKY